MRCTLLLIATLLFVGIATAARAATVAYWRFEEGTVDAIASGGSGSVLDETGNHHGTPSGADGPIYRSDVPVDPIPQTGASNSLSLQFDGIDDYVEVADHADFDLTHAVTVEAFFKAPGSQTGSLFKGLVTKGGMWSEESSYQLLADTVTAGGPFARANVRLDNDTIVQLAGSALQPDEWYHAALVVDIDGSNGGAAHLYVAGLTTSFFEHKTVNIGAGRTMKLNDAAVRIGDTSTNGPRSFMGLIDEARISNVALSPDQFLNVPEPATLSLLAIAGLFGLGVRARPRKRK